MAYTLDIRVRDTGSSYIVTRLYDGVPVDRYTTSDLKVPRKSGGWTAAVSAMANAPSAHVVIDIPPVPPLEPTREERLRAELALAASDARRWYDASCANRDEAIAQQDRALIAERKLQLLENQAGE